MSDWTPPLIPWVRRWTRLAPPADASTSLTALGDLRDRPCLILLGEPGMGKTVAVQQEIANLNVASSRGASLARLIDLRLYAQSVERLERLFDGELATWAGGEGNRFLFLDALDEAILDVAGAAELLVQRTSALATGRLHLRIVARLGTWPASVEPALRERFGVGGVERWCLAPLLHEDILEAFRPEQSAEAQRFMATVSRRGVWELATRPITLRMLQAEFGRGGELSTSRGALFGRGCQALADEHNDRRRERNETGVLTPAQRVMVAERVAALTVLCGRVGVWEGSFPAPDDDILLDDLCGGEERTAEVSVAVQAEAIRETFAFALFQRDPVGRRALWAHRVFAEFLAALWLSRRDLPVDQLWALLGVPGFAEREVRPQLRGLACWLADFAPAWRASLLSGHAEIVLASDLPPADASLRRDLFDALVEQIAANPARIREVIGVGARLAQLRYDGLGDQIAHVLDDPGQSLEVRAFACTTAAICEVSSVVERMIAIAFDVGQDMNLREGAAWAAFQGGDAAQRRRLLPLTQAHDSDPEGRLRATVLSLLWPDHLTIEELLASIAHEIPENFVSRVALFVDHSLARGLRPEHAAPILRWVYDNDAVRRNEAGHRFGGIIRAGIVLGLAQLDDADVRPPFMATLTTLFREGWYNWGDMLPQCLEADPINRRALLDRLIEWYAAKSAAPEELRGLRMGSVSLWSRGADQDWAAEQLLLATGLAEVLWAEILFSVVDWRDPNAVGRALAIRRQSVAFAQTTQAMVDAHGGEPHALVASLERAEEADRARWQRPAPASTSPSPIEHVMSLLDEIEAKGVDGVGAERLVRVLGLLAYDETGWAHHDIRIAHIKQLAGWRLLDEKSQARVTAACRRFLVAVDPAHPPGDNAALASWIDLVGVRALEIVSQSASRPAGLPRALLTRWLPALLEYLPSPEIGGEDQHAIDLSLGQQAAQCAPEVVATTLAGWLDNPEKWGRLVECLELFWCSALGPLLEASLRSQTLEKRHWEKVFEVALQQQPALARTVIDALIEAGLAPDRLAAAAHAWLLKDPRAAWPAVHGVLRERPEVARIALTPILMLIVTSTTTLPSALDEGELEQLFSLLVESFGVTRDDVPRHAMFMGHETQAVLAAELVLQHLQRRASPAAVDALRSLQDRHPTWDLRVQIDQTRTAVFQRARTWASPREVLALGRTGRRYSAAEIEAEEGVAMSKVPGPLLADVSSAIAEVTEEASLSSRVLLASVGYPAGRLNLNQDPMSLWHQACSGLSGGISAQAGEGVDALVALLNVIAAEVPGNSRILTLSRKLGGALHAAPGARGAIFLSYATVDRAAVDQVHDAILRADPAAVVFQDHRSIRPGQLWADVIRDNAGQSAVMACWLTPAWLASVYTQYEVGVAEARSGAIVPVEADPGILGKVPAFVGNRQSVRLPHSPDSVAAVLLAARP